MTTFLQFDGLLTGVMVNPHPYRALVSTAAYLYILCLDAPRAPGRYLRRLSRPGIDWLRHRRRSQTTSGHATGGWFARFAASLPRQSGLRLLPTRVRAPTSRHNRWLSRSTMACSHRLADRLYSPAEHMRTSASVGYGGRPPCCPARGQACPPPQPWLDRLCRNRGCTTNRSSAASADGCA